MKRRQRKYPKRKSIGMAWIAGVWRKPTSHKRKR